MEFCLSITGVAFRLFGQLLVGVGPGRVGEAPLPHYRACLRVEGVDVILWLAVNTKSSRLARYGLLQQQADR